MPADAVIRPYDPQFEGGIRAADRVLVPFDRYIELWNRARPDKKLETRENPVPYAWAGASYAATLLDDDVLTLTAGWRSTYTTRAT